MNESNRRIGERRPVHPVPLVWTTPHVGPRGPLGLRRAYRRRSPGTLVELSVSGALIDGPAFPHLVDDVPAKVAIDDIAALVRIRRDEQVGADLFRYGVEFVDLDRGFRDHLFGFTGNGRPYQLV